MSKPGFKIDLSNPRTTALGIIQALIVLLGIVAAIIDGNAETQGDIMMAVLILRELVGVPKAYMTSDKKGA